MDAGKRDRRIRLQRQIAGGDAAGQPNGAWITIDVVWSEFEPKIGREFLASRVAQSTGDATFRILWRGDVETTWRISFDGRLYDIKSTIEIGRREGLSILGEARQT